MSNLPFGINLNSDDDGGAPASEFTRKFIKDVLAKKKSEPDRNGNPDSVFNGSIMKASYHAPLGTTQAKNEPEENAENLSRDQSKVPQYSTDTTTIVRESKQEKKHDSIIKTLKALKTRLKSEIKKVD